MNKTKKMMSGVVATLMAVSVVGCSNQDEVSDDTSINNDRPPEPTDVSCSDWDWDDETGTYYCDDRRSSNFGMYYLMGSLFNSKSALRSSSQYKSYQQGYRPRKDDNSSGSAGYTGGSSSSSKKDANYKSGIGSGSKGSYGG